MRRHQYEFFFIEPEEPGEPDTKYLVFSSALISSSLRHEVCHGKDGRVRGFHLLKENEWLIRTSSLKGVLTIDYKKEGQSLSLRCYLTTQGWRLDDGNSSRFDYCTDPSMSVLYADQLLDVLNHLSLLQGLHQVLPDNNMAATDEMFSAYCIHNP
ncbi:hypothetical protein Lqui_2688 [Legionella quinlivanii]|uniref:Uncharacterized protein n=1 Tax=Legionella quinlivanii TaxID=45073 RepID=A0A0W0XKL3_9GAMM|nr:hypothetical protein [Legionella quinlivanii]KTD45217.1 hypothetical protein Lqui_2688 [Legionella quinlivanii]SEG04851.1 hypothetical protein SAMN02746093_01738 [Legionella quinlivanii DSM 21216]STY11483.1 Uncharacterised protein [Legionella quinlivanii]